jgi:hypothetical protein
MYFICIILKCYNFIRIMWYMTYVFCTPFKFKNAVDMNSHVEELN